MFLLLSSGGRTRTSVLRVMSPTSYQLLYPAMRFVSAKVEKISNSAKILVLFCRCATQSPPYRAGAQPLWARKNHTTPAPHFGAAMLHPLPLVVHKREGVLKLLAALELLAPDLAPLGANLGKARVALDLYTNVGYVELSREGHCLAVNLAAANDENLLLALTHCQRPL